ncbi:MAG: NAD(P)H-hydrate dehydratase [Candidatus Heimdallarchaeota archaeon]
MVITAEEVKIIDANSEELGVSGLQLMENAGAATAQTAIDSFPDAEKIAICCGTGNNGGDGFVTARHLASYNKKMKVILVGNIAKIRSEIALHNFNILKEMEDTIQLIVISDSANLHRLKTELKDVDLVIDALLGVGLTKEPYDPIKSAIKEINSAKKKILSVDVPSGIWSDVPKKQKNMIKADKIITFHDTKPCLTLADLKEITDICSIGVPPEAEIFVGKGDVFATLPARKETSHKGQNGKVLVVGGSLKYSGAPVLSSRAALRTGADLVITCIPESIARSVRSDSPNMIVQSFPGDYLEPQHIPEILKLMKKFDSIVVGPGLSENPASLEFVKELLKQLPKEKPVIIDADALKAIKNNLELLQGRPNILTPHQGEFKILFGDGLPKAWQDRIDYLTEIAENCSSTVLLKGKYDVISNGVNSKVNRTGHEGMTVGGTGDVLAGILGALCAVNPNLFRVACASSYIAGKAGEIAAEDFGNSLLATDVIEKIPEVILSIKNREK